MPKNDLAWGDHVTIPWGFDREVVGIVQEIYGPTQRRHVIVLLSPEVSGDVVGETATVSMPIDVVTKVSPAA